MKDKQIQDAVTTMLSGLEVSPDLLDKLQKGDAPKKSYSGMRFSRKVLLIVTIALVLFAVCGTSIGMPMLKIYKKMNPDIFALQIDMNKPMPGIFEAVEQTKEAAETWGTDLTDMLYAINACTRIPEWKPERYSNCYDTNVTWDELFGNELRKTFYIDKEQQLTICVRVLPEDGSFSSTTLYQHDDTENEIWKFGDVEYTLLKNFQYHSLNWQENNCTIHIAGIFDRDEALKMVKSIYD